MNEEDLDLDSRELCGDDACIGVLRNGRCGECGRTPAEAAAGVGARGALASPAQTAWIESEAAPPGDADWQTRELCPDDACIGVLASDGHCGECGRSRA